MIKETPRNLNTLTKKNEKSYVSLPIACIRPSLSRNYQTVAIIIH